MRQIMRALIGLKPTAGSIGVEIEVEGDNLPSPCDGWRAEGDDSLRGGIEYVLNKPLSDSEVFDSLEKMCGRFNSGDVEVIESVRSAVHIHVNVQDKTPCEVFNFVTLYLILEEVLTAYCGPHRDGNLFCLRAKDAEYLTHKISHVVGTQRFKEFNDDDIRYSSINLKALATYGSLEFRAMRTPPAEGMYTAISDWISILMCIRDFSFKFKDPTEVVAELKNTGLSNFLCKIFGDFSKELSSIDGYAEKVRSGLVNAMDVAHCTDWSTFDKEVAVNPFAASLK